MNKLSFEDVDSVSEACHWCSKHLTETEWNVVMTNWGKYDLYISNDRMFEWASLKFN